MPSYTTIFVLALAASNVSPALSAPVLQVREQSLSHRGPKIGAAPSKRANWGALLKKVGIELGIGTASTVAGYAALDAITGPSKDSDAPATATVPANPGPAPPPANSGPAPQSANPGPDPQPANSGPAPQPANSGTAPQFANPGPAPQPANSGPATQPANPGPAPQPANSGSAPPPGPATSGTAPPNPNYQSNTDSGSSIFGEPDL
ncbi:hypothetical protein V8E52_011755 [Russula decolorans]